MDNVKVITRELITTRGSYVVVSFYNKDNMLCYGTINREHLNNDGTLNKVLTGLDMLIEPAYNKAVDRRIKSDLVDDYMERGYGFGDAFNIAYDANFTDEQIQALNSIK